MRADIEAPERQQYLSFVLAGGDYAIPILKLREILQHEGLTRVPGTPRSIRGVLNLRGRVVPVVDLALKFGLDETAETRWTCVLVVEAAHRGEQMLVGVMADSVREVMDLRAEDVEKPPAFGPDVRVDWLIGMGKLERRFVLLLDIDRVLSTDERDLAAALAEAAGNARPEAAGAGPVAPPEAPPVQEAAGG